MAGGPDRRWREIAGIIGSQVAGQNGAIGSEKTCCNNPRMAIERPEHFARAGFGVGYEGRGAIHGSVACQNHHVVDYLASQSLDVKHNETRERKQHRGDADRHDDDGQLPANR